MTRISFWGELIRESITSPQLLSSALTYLILDCHIHPYRLVEIAHRRLKLPHETALNSIRESLKEIISQNRTT